MKIEVGKYYRDGTGNIIGPIGILEYSFEIDVVFKNDSKISDTYTIEGKWFSQLEGPRDSLFDLVEECDPSGNAIKKVEPEEGITEEKPAIEAETEVAIVEKTSFMRQRREELAEKIMMAVLTKWNELPDDQNFNKHVKACFELADTFIAESNNW